jgi:putative flavoprotein involved in K+ transport
MRRTRVIIVGGGQAGLAMSRCLTDRSIDHVVLERGDIAERWRSERWESLRLLTPNWQTRLPGFSYDGNDPHGYMSAADVAHFLSRYAQSFAAPLEVHTPVRRVEPHAAGFRVVTDRTDWHAEAVVVATGHSDLPRVPAVARHLPRHLDQITPPAYRRPSQLREGGVLVVGAAATGIQLAHELRSDGRTVVVAVGQHTRVPRCYRGRDILWWLERMGILDETEGDVFDVEISREQASFQLVGREDHASIDLALLQDAGVEVVGRLVSADDRAAYFDDDLITTTVAADVKLANLLGRIDRYIAAEGGNNGPSEQTFEPIWQRFQKSREQIDLRAWGITSVLWATGFRREYPWLLVPGLLDARGEIRHSSGISAVPGVYVLGLQFLRHRNSSFIDGVGRDAVWLSEHLAGYLGSSRAVA